MNNAQAILSSYGLQQPCTITHAITLNDTTDSGVGTLHNYTTGSFTPAAGDLLVVTVVWPTTGGAIAGQTTSVTDSLGTTFTLALGVNFGVHRNSVFQADALSTNASRTITAAVTPPAGVTAGGCDITVLRIAGMSKVSNAAKRQSANSSSSAGQTPAPAFAKAALTLNPCVALVGNSNNPAGMTNPSGWSSANDSGFATPACGISTSYIASGFTGTTVTWGSTTATASENIIVEFDNS